MKEKNRKSGFIGLIIVLLFALALSKYVLNWDLIEFIKSPKILEIFAYIKKAIILVWNKILVTPVVFVWEKIIVNIIWKSILTAYGLLKHWVDNQA